MTRTLALYGLAAVAEIGGCYAFWRWLKGGAAIWHAALGIVALVVFAVVLTRVDSAAAGRAYAAYGGIYIAASLVWLRWAEGVRPSWTDLAGAAVSVAGAAIILAGARR